MPVRVQVKFLIAVAASFAGCGALPTQVELRPGVADCAGSASLRGLHVYVLGDGNMDEFIFEGDKVQQSVSGYEPIRRIPRNDPGVLGRIKDKFPSEPDRLSSGEMLSFPAASSPDGGRWAAAIVTKDRHSAKEFVIRDGKAFHRLSNLPDFYVETLAWSPDSGRLAVIEVNFDITARTFLDVISPHPVQYSDVVLTVYAPSGNVICQAVIVKKRAAASPIIEWPTQ